MRAISTKLFLLCRAFARQSFNKLYKFETILQLSIFDIPQPKETKNFPSSTGHGNVILLEELFEAYFECRKNKRSTANAIGFEINYENNLFQLCQEINNGTYKIGRSIAFIVDKPVTREIFAADFRDRVVHHLIIKKINHLFEKQFIYDSYSCRLKKGTHFGIQRIDKFIRKCSKNYTKDCFILKLDIQAFFMHINKNVLFQKLEKFINEKYNKTDKEIILRLCKQIIYNEPTKNCIIKGKRTNWDSLPKTKSLFHTQKNTGLPIGNLTSQIFANFYMDTLDHYIKHDLQIKFYGRYVDDFVIVHQNKEYLKELINKISDFLKTELKLTLHPKKIHLQHYKKGVLFLGNVIMPNRIYTRNRTIGNFYDTIAKWNILIRKNKKLTRAELDKFISSMNSYLGIMKHYKTYKIRKKMLKNLSAWIFNQVYISNGYCKLVATIKYH